MQFLRIKLPLNKFTKFPLLQYCHLVNPRYFAKFPFLITFIFDSRPFRAMRISIGKFQFLLILLLPNLHFAHFVCIIFANSHFPNEHYLAKLPEIADCNIPVSPSDLNRSAQRKASWENIIILTGILI
jgi:hypothetical protein